MANQGQDLRSRTARAKRMILWSLLLIAVGTFAAPFSGYLYVWVASPAAHAQEATPTPEGGTDNPRANYWRAVRGGNEGYTSASGAYTTNTLINNGGQVYREWRNGPLASIGPWVLGVVLLAIVLFYLFRGPMEVPEPESGRMVPRWGLGERTMHWFTALFFVICALTGLSLLFGRAVLIPVFGLEGFAAYAGVAKVLHNWSGPLLLIGVLAEVITWLRYNIPRKEDWEWLKRIGGMFGGPHPHAGRANAGEKVWFWIVFIVGLIGVGITGLIADFPALSGDDRATMQLVLLIHAALGTLWVAISLGHIYLGTLGTKGALNGMVRGEVSEEWMKHHHDLWYQEMQKQGAPGAERPATGPAGQTPST